MYFYFTEINSLPQPSAWGWYTTDNTNHMVQHLVHALEFRRFYCIANHRSRTTRVNNKNKVSLGRACKMQIHLTKKGKKQLWKKHHRVLVHANVSFLGYFLVHVQCSRPHYVQGFEGGNQCESQRPNSFTSSTQLRWAKIAECYVWSLWLGFSPSVRLIRH